MVSIERRINQMLKVITYNELLTQSQNYATKREFKKAITVLKLMLKYF